MGSVAVIIPFLFCFLVYVKNCQGFGTYGFDVHHRYSDTVQDFLDVDGLPEKGSLHYYAAMAHRDNLFKARRLATTTPADNSSLLTFFGRNDTYRVSSLGFLHYSIVTVGTPAVNFLVALDTGSDLFWLPCDCNNCVRSLNSSSGRNLELNIYNYNTSSTSARVPCNSTLCGPRRGCALRRNACAYQEVYLSSNTSTTGILVNDVLHMGSDSSPQSRVEAPITLGCGIIQTGDFLDGAAINGLFGLGMDSISVPSTLASRGLAANSFSMCFGQDGLGRIEFGDKGSPGQQVTPFNIEDTHPTYNVTVTRITVGDNVTNLEFTAIFDSGTSFTYLNDPAYSVIVEGFDSQVTEPRYQPDTDIIFDYCYSLSANQDSYSVPDLNFTMRGGGILFITAPTIVIPGRAGGSAYCLAMVRSNDVNIIGQNFMTGYRMVFDREDMTLGWRETSCYDSINSGSTTLPTNRPNSTNHAPTPSSSLDPEATPANRTTSPVDPSQPSIPIRPSSGNDGSDATSLSSVSNKFLMVILSVFAHHILIHL